MPFNPKNWNDFDEIYFKEVDRCALSRVDTPINNSHPKHAVYLINKLFVLAQKKVRIFSDCLIPVVKADDCPVLTEDIEMYGHPLVIQNACDFLREDGSEIAIVLERTPCKNNPLLKALVKLKNSGEMKGCFTIKQLPQNIADGWLKKSFDHHFMVSDGSAYRVEKDPRPESFTAYANFGDKEFTKRFIDYFDSALLKLSKPVELNY